MQSKLYGNSLKRNYYNTRQKSIERKSQHSYHEFTCLMTLPTHLTPAGPKLVLVAVGCVPLDPRCVWSFHRHKADSMSMPRLMTMQDGYAPLFPGNLRYAWRFA